MMIAHLLQCCQTKPAMQDVELKLYILDLSSRNATDTAARLRFDMQSMVEKDGDLQRQ